MSQEMIYPTVPMNDEKGGKDSPWWKSTSLIGALVLVLLVVLANMTGSANTTIDEAVSRGFNQEGFDVYLLSEHGKKSFPGFNETGMAVYQQSEWGFQAPATSSDREGLEIYHNSERSASAVQPISDTQAGMDIYHASERGLSSPVSKVSNEEGLAIYLESERTATPVQPVSDAQEGLAIYQASERGTSAAPIRLYDGQPFNAYQRSEWLGEDR